MSHKEYIDKLSLDQLDCLVEMARAKISSIRSKKRVEYVALTDDWANIAFFDKQDVEGPLKHFEKAYRSKIASGHFEQLRLEVQSDFPDEVPNLEKF